MIELVIKIPEKMYKEYVSVNLGRRNGKTITYNLLKAIKKGTPLPKGHGDLIDRSEVIKNLFDYHNGKKTIGQCIDDAPTIIEADECTYKETGCGSCKRQLDCPIEAEDGGSDDN